MSERSTYDIRVEWTEPEFDREVRRDMTLTDATYYMKSVVRSSEVGKPTTITVTRKIPF